MQGIDVEIREIRERVIESERRTLLKKAARKFPKDKKRQEAYVYKTLNARYGQPKQTDLAEEERVEKIQVEKIQVEKIQVEKIHEKFMNFLYLMRRI